LIDKKGGMYMKKVLTILATAMAISVVLITSLGVTALADVEGYGYGEAAPNSGDCYPDGSGFDGEVGNGKGPAPNAGSGLHEGSGF